MPCAMLSVLPRGDRPGDPCPGVVHGRRVRLAVRARLRWGGRGRNRRCRRRVPELLAEPGLLGGPVVPFRPVCAAAAFCLVEAKTPGNDCAQMLDDAGVDAAAFAYVTSGNCVSDCQMDSNWSCVGNVAWPPAVPGDLTILLSLGDGPTGEPRAGVTAVLCNSPVDECGYAGVSGVTIRTRRFPRPARRLPLEHLHRLVGRWHRPRAVLPFVPVQSVAGVAAAADGRPVGPRRYPR